MLKNHKVVKESMRMHPFEFATVWVQWKSHGRTPSKTPVIPLGTMFIRNLNNSVLNFKNIILVIILRYFMFYSSFTNYL